MSNKKKNTKLFTNTEEALNDKNNFDNAIEETDDVNLVDNEMKDEIIENSENLVSELDTDEEIVNKNDDINDKDLKNSSDISSMKSCITNNNVYIEVISNSNPNFVIARLDKIGISAKLFDNKILVGPYNDESCDDIKLDKRRIMGRGFASIIISI